MSRQAEIPKRGKTAESAAFPGRDRRWVRRRDLRDCLPIGGISASFETNEASRQLRYLSGQSAALSALPALPLCGRKALATLLALFFFWAPALGAGVSIPSAALPGLFPSFRHNSSLAVVPDQTLNPSERNSSCPESPYAAPSSPS